MPPQPPQQFPSASFTLTNFGVVSTVSKTAGDGQAAKVGTAFANALTVTVVDNAGNTVPLVPVLFSLPTSGAGGTFPGGLTVATAISDANGRATSPVITANNTAGSWTATATAP